MLHYRIQRKRRRSDSKKCASEILDARTLKQWRFLMIIWVSSTQRTRVIWQLCRQQDVLAAGHTRRLTSEWSSPLPTARRTDGASDERS